MQGFPKDRELESIREKIRKAFKDNTLEHSIDSRYRLTTAHATIARFKTEVAHPTLFLENIQKLRDIPIGSFRVDELELVFNDWYQRKDKTAVLGRFPLVFE